MESDGPEHIAAVVEGNYPESLLDRQRNAELGIDEKQLVAADRDRDLHTGARIGRITARRHHSLRSSSVQGKPAQGVRSATKECLAERNVIAECFCKSKAHAVGPYDLLFREGLVVCSLREKLSEVEVRAQE